MAGNLYNNQAGDRYLRGDTDPQDFSWNDLLTREDMLNLLCRNGKIRKACAWVSREAVRPRFELKQDKKMPGTKFGKPYTFETIVEYLEWIEFFGQLECGYTWARLFGTAIIVMYKEDEGKKPKYEPLPAYDTCQAYYPLTGGNGYEIVNDGSDEQNLYYKITFTNILGNQDSFLVHSKRVVVFNAPHLELNYEGNSEVEALAKIAIVQEQMFKSVMKRLHEMGAGVIVVAVANEDEKAAIDTSIGDAMKYTHKIYTTGDPKAVMESFVPDIKSNQFREIWDIAQEEIANNMNMSKKLISCDPQGQVSSARWDTEISYTEVYQTQRHYKKSTENVLFLLGIEDTTIMWNDPFPTEQVDNVVDKDGNPKPDPDGQEAGRDQGGNSASATDRPTDPKSSKAKPASKRN